MGGESETGVLPAGTRIAEKYVLGEPLGRGENSIVYDATHRLLQRRAAVKVFKRGPDPAAERRFEREARLAGSLDHPNVVEIYELGRLEDGRPFLVMEHLEGETLSRRLERLGPMALPEVTRIARQLLLGLSAAHEQEIVHRDVRPDNIFLANVRGEEVVKILDFGIARRFGQASDTLTAPGTLLGDLAYLAPEQLMEDGEIDERVDIYATGVVLYVLLSGRMPFESKGPTLIMDIVEASPPPPSVHRRGLTKDVDQVVLCALAKSADERFPSALAMSEALRLATLFSDYVLG